MNFSNLHGEYVFDIDTFLCVEIFGVVSTLELLAIVRTPRPDAGVSNL